jgi:hypothetical protein
VDITTTEKSLGILPSTFLRKRFTPSFEDITTPFLGNKKPVITGLSNCGSGGRI